MPGEADDIRSSLEHLQAAAHEVIQATRSLLDAAEDLIDDPAAVQGVVATLASVAQAAAARLRSEPPSAPGASSPDGDDDDPDDGRVQRIRIT